MRFGLEIMTNENPWSEVECIESRALLLSDHDECFLAAEQERILIDHCLHNVL